jgi:chemotaxis protein methyltransferase CheR
MRSARQVRDYVATHFGIHYPASRLAELWRKLESLRAWRGDATIADCIDALLSGRLDDASLNRLVESITVGETYFFREPEAIEAIVTTIIPTIERRGRRTLRIWVAGCASGEEPYTVAMLLHSRLPELADWNVSLLASDLNRAFLARAEKGIYGQWSFRALPSHYQSRYFHNLSDGRFELDQEIRRMVRFERINLVSGHYPSPLNGTQECDLILCRNVLMYFAPDTISVITARLGRALVDDGWLIVSQTECGDYFSACFETVQAGSVFLYRKRGAGAAAPPLRDVEKFVEKRPVSPHLPAPRPVLFPPVVSEARDTMPVKPGQREAPLDHESLFSRARSLADAGQLEEARLRCEEGLRLEPLSLHGQYLHAVILLELGLLDDARVALRKALYLNPDFVMASYMLGVVEEKQGNRRTALGCFDRTARMLAGYGDEQQLPEAEGLTVAHLREYIDARRKG